MLRTAAIELDVAPEPAVRLAALQAAYARLRAKTPLGSQMFGENNLAAPVDVWASARGIASSAPTVVSGRTAT